jgi:hypothetical protein
LTNTSFIKNSALPVVPKIFYKQNSQDNAKGADSVHIVIKDNDFSLWFGEAKFYRNIDIAITSAVDSVDAFLRNDDQIKKENSIITSVSDIDQMGLDDELVKQIKLTLNGENSLDNSIILRILLIKDFWHNRQGRIMIFHNAIKKENSIITSVSDIDQMGLDDELVKQIKLTLNGENSLDNQYERYLHLLHYLENFAYKRFLAQQARQNNDLS